MNNHILLKPLDDSVNIMPIRYGFESISIGLIDKPSSIVENNSNATIHKGSIPKS